VLKLRFDAERSPLDGIPVALRRPLYELLLEHATGAARRHGRTWVDFDLLRDPDLAAPYRPDRATARGDAPPASRRPRPGVADYVLAELTWVEAKARLGETDLALLPVGSIEQHGPHLPLDIDAWDADYLARRVAAACSAPRPLVLPLIPYGVSYHHEDFPGTIGIAPETLARLVYEVGMSVARQGITKLIILNGHGGNVPTLQFAAQNVNRDARIFTCVETGDTSDTDVARLVETRGDVHAGEIETSTALATRPELVQMEQASRCVPRFSSQYLEFSSARSVEWFARTAKLSASGVLGDPTRASREKGEQIWRTMIDHLVRFVESLKGLSLDEIYEKRY
jgi:creatinine amidohydrolase/Fe(II)-dependent formamide hydrolase-like protein